MPIRKKRQGKIKLQGPDGTFITADATEITKPTKGEKWELLRALSWARDTAQLSAYNKPMAPRFEKLRTMVALSMRVDA